MDLTVDEIGTYLEHVGYSDDQIDEFLEHFGVKGMRWGVKKQIYPNGQTRIKRTAGSKLTIAGAALGSTMLSGAVIKKFTGGRVSPMTVSVSMLAGGASAIAGARMARTIVDKHGNVSSAELKRLKGKHIDDPGLTGKEKAYAGYTIAGAALMGYAVKKGLSAANRGALGG